jgi:hypothetical protein
MANFVPVKALPHLNENDEIEWYANVWDLVEWLQLSHDTIAKQVIDSKDEREILVLQSARRQTASIMTLLRGWVIGLDEDTDDKLTAGVKMVVDGTEVYYDDDKDEGE